MTFRCHPDDDWLFDRPNDARAEIDRRSEAPPVTPSARLRAIAAGEPSEPCPRPGQAPICTNPKGRSRPMSEAGRARVAEAFKRTRARWGQRGGRPRGRGQP